MNTAQAVALFHLKTPTTLNTIKTVFRALSKQEHPDTSKHPQAKERFQQVRDAYEVLKADKSILLDTGEVTTTISGERLVDLGKGLGPTTNGTGCEECDGRGYRLIATDGWNPCTDCMRLGFSLRRLYRCQKCMGTGTFTRNGKNVGQCFNCNGKGWINYFRNHGACRSCNDTGEIRASASRAAYTCTKCKGCGELPMWNPVLPKGLLL